MQVWLVCVNHILSPNARFILTPSLDHVSYTPERLERLPQKWPRRTVFSPSDRIRLLYNVSELSKAGLTQVSSLLSGEPPLQTVFHPDPIQMLRMLRALLRMVFRPALRTLLRPSIRPPNHPGHLSALVGTCCAIRPAIIVDTSGHVLLGSYQLVYKVSPSVGIRILSSLRIPPLGA
jgi:hypothetical protein